MDAQAIAMTVAVDTVDELPTTTTGGERAAATAGSAGSMPSEEA